MLGNDHLSYTSSGSSALIFRNPIVFRTVEEHNHICILFDGPRFTKIGELWSFISAAGFYRSRKLGKCNHWNAQFLSNLLQCTGDAGNFLLSVSSKSTFGISRHQLEVIHYHHLDIVLRLQLSTLCSQFQNGQCRGIIHKKWGF